MSEEMAEVEVKDKSKDKYKILLLEKDFDISDQMVRVLKNNRRFHCEVTTVSKGEDAVEEVECEDYDLILADNQIGDMNGIEFLKSVKTDHFSDAVRLLILKGGEKCLAEEAVEKGEIDGYIENPYNSQEVRITVFEKLNQRKILKKDKKVEVDGVFEALETLKNFQRDISSKSSSSTEKETFIFEFNSNLEFNKFSFELKRMKNVQILGVHIFEDKYVINVGLYPQSYEKIR